MWPRMATPVSIDAVVNACCQAVPDRDTQHHRCCHGGVGVVGVVVMARASACSAGSVKERSSSSTCHLAQIVTWNVSRSAYMAHVSEEQFASMSVLITDKDVLPKVSSTAYATLQITNFRPSIADPSER